MSDEIGARLKQARLAAGFKTAAAAARAKGFHPQNLADHEAGRRGVSLDHADAYARAFRINPFWLLWGTGGPHDRRVEGDIMDAQLATRAVPIEGEVQSGSFSEAPAEKLVEAYVPISLPEYNQATLFALNIRGPSMNSYYPDGSVVIGCPVAEVGVRDGDHVVVRRRFGTLVETSIKEVVANVDGTTDLWPRSLDPAHQTPIRFDPPPDDALKPEIVGVVVAAIIKRSPSTGTLLFPKQSAIDG